MRWGKIEGHDGVRRQNIAERVGVALFVPVVLEGQLQQAL